MTLAPKCRSWKKQLKFLDDIAAHRALQANDVDTYDANLMLGFEEDERDFSVASLILKRLGVGAIRLLTNNPHKMDMLAKTGIRIESRVPLKATPGKHNHAYLDTKVKKSGHLL
jgi:GTP cyclohydrolase II